MTFALSWLPVVLRTGGVSVTEETGWQNRGHGDMGFVKGILLHHTAGPLTGNMPSLQTLINGRPDLAGPLCNLALGRDGTYYIIAAGKGYHAGQGQYQGIVNGNSELIGIEAENTGLANDPWPDIQMDAYVKGCVAILKHINAHSIMVAGHKEYATPHGRKDDPSFDMDAFRLKVHNLLMQ